MPLKFFAIPALDPAQAEEDLNRFLRAHRAVSITRQLVTAEDRVIWCVAIEYLDGAAQRHESTGHGEASRRSRIDYKEILSPPDFMLFSKLRDWRKQVAETDGLPVYAVCTNEQLAAIARQRPGTLAALQAIDGIGDGKAQRYGPPLMGLLAVHPNPEATGIVEVEPTTEPS